VLVSWNNIGVPIQWGLLLLVSGLVLWLTPLLWLTHFFGLPHSLSFAHHHLQATVSISAGVFCYYLIPSPEEYFARAREALGAEAPEDQPSFLTIFKDLFDVIRQQWRAALVCTVCVGLPFIFVAYWAGTFYPYEVLLLGRSEGDSLANFFGLALSIVGCVFGMITGVFVDKACSTILITVDIRSYILLLRLGYFGFLCFNLE